MDRKLAIIFLAFLTIGLGVVAVFIAVDLHNKSSGEDVSVGNESPNPSIEPNYTICGGSTECEGRSDGYQLSCDNGLKCTCRAIETDTSIISTCKDVYPQGVLARSCANDSSCSENPPQQQDQVCNPNQWFGCNYGRCSDGQSARCNASGTDYDCFDDPSTCGGNSNPGPSSAPTQPSPPPATPPASSPPPAASSSATSSENTQTAQSAGNTGGNTGTDTLPATGFIDENPYLVIGLLMLVIGGWFSLVRIKEKSN